MIFIRLFIEIILLIGLIIIGILGIQHTNYKFDKIISFIALLILIGSFIGSYFNETITLWITFILFITISTIYVCEKYSLSHTNKN